MVRPKNTMLIALIEGSHLMIVLLSSYFTMSLSLHELRRGHSAIVLMTA